MWQTITAIGVPIITAVIAALAGGGFGLQRRVKNHAELLKVLEGTRAKAKLEDLLVVEIEALVTRAKSRALKKLNGVNVTMAVLMTGGISLGFYWLFNWIVAWSGQPYMWVAIVISALAGLLGLLIIGASWGTIYNETAPPKVKKSPRS